MSLTKFQQEFIQKITELERFIIEEIVDYSPIKKIVVSRTTWIKLGCPKSIGCFSEIIIEREEGVTTTP